MPVEYRVTLGPLTIKKATVGLFRSDIQKWANLPRLNPFDLTAIAFEVPNADEVNYARGIDGLSYSTRLRGHQINKQNIETPISVLGTRVKLS